MARLAYQTWTDYNDNAVVISYNSANGNCKWVNIIAIHNYS